MVVDVGLMLLLAHIGGRNQLVEQLLASLESEEFTLSHARVFHFSLTLVSLYLSCWNVATDIYAFFDLNPGEQSNIGHSSGRIYVLSVTEEEKEQCIGSLRPICRLYINRYCNFHLFKS